MMRLTLDIASTCLFGAHASDGAIVGRAFTDVSHHFATIGANPLIPLWLPLRANHRYRRALQELETSALTLSYTLYLLARYPSVQAKLDGELEAELGGDSPGLDSIQRLRYLDQVVKESMRLYPAPYAFGREACADDTIAGHHIPHKAQMIVCPYTMHRNPQYYTHPLSGASNMSMLFWHGRAARVNDKPFASS